MAFRMRKVRRPVAHKPGGGTLRELQRMPRVSVVIPTVGRPTLRAAVDSVGRQSVLPDEIVVVNDSPEQLSVTSELGANVVEEFTGGGKGPSAARNKGVDRAQGELIAYLDDDDLWLPHHIASALQSFERTPELDLYACTMIQTHEDGLKPDSKVVFRGREHLVDFLYGRYCWARQRRSIPPSTWVFRRETCDFPMDENVCYPYEDTWWLLNLDERDRVLRQSTLTGGLKFEHRAGTLGHYAARANLDVIINWARRIEGLRQGAGQHFLIGVMGRHYARNGMRDEWIELMEKMPREWKVGWDYRLIGATEKALMRQRANRALRISSGVPE